MEEETENQEEETKQPQVIEDANAVAERIEKANEKTEELLLRQENIIAQKQLGGKSSAGDNQVIEKKEVSDTEYAEKALQGINANEE